MKNNWRLKIKNVLKKYKGKNLNAIKERG